MGRLTYLLVALCLASSMFAQLPEQTMKKGREVLDNLMNSKGDKVFEQLNGEMKTAISAPQLNALWMGLMMQFGECKSISGWKEQKMGSSDIITSRLAFKNRPLLFMVSFSDGKINGLRVMPDPEGEVKSAQPQSNDVFEEREVTIKTGKFELPGFLTIPKNGSDFPCVILVHGSGANDRNESLGENRPFEDLAHGLAKCGIATIRYDKRAFVYGENSLPEGEYLTLDNEVTADALSAVALARSTAGIDSAKVFLLGHSLGAMMAPRIATLCPDLKGIVMMAGNARPFDVILAEQITYLSSLESVPGVEAQLDEMQKQFANVRKHGTPGYEESVQPPLGQPLSYWLSFENYSQTETAKGLMLPVLILNGERDYNVPMTDFNIWRKELEGNKNVAFKSYPVLNHLFMDSSEKPTPKDYLTVRHIPDYVIMDIANWIKERR